LLQQRRVLERVLGDGLPRCLFVRGLEEDKPARTVAERAATLG
jgi:hypothetical protein